MYILLYAAMIIFYFISSFILFHVVILSAEVVPLETATKDGNH